MNSSLTNILATTEGVRVVRQGVTVTLLGQTGAVLTLEVGRTLVVRVLCFRIAVAAFLQTPATVIFIL